MSFSGIKYIFLRELKNYYNTPIGYVFGISSLFFNFLFFFNGLLGIIPEFWRANLADIRAYLNLLPISYILFVPAVCMRIWSEERKQGTFELLSSLPLRDSELVLGKFLAAWLFVGGLLFAAIPLTVSIYLIGPLDPGATFAMFLGSFLMAGAYTATGMVISALTREQIVAFIAAFFVNLLMFVGNYFVITRGLPLKISRWVGFFSYGYHFESFSRGLIELGDVVYYISFIGLMLVINVWLIRRER